jgi:DNA-binding GntR family transcriptional regulator
MAIELKTTSVPDAVYEAVREGIIGVELEPGSLVTETALALRYGVARPTAKAAIERLVTEGLLRRQAHKAARVPELSRSDLEEVYATRALIEEAALRSLAAHSRIPTAAQAAHNDLVAHSGNGDYAALARDDIAFHRALVLGQDSARLARMHDLIMGEVELCIGQVQSYHLMRPAEIVDQHQGILDAVAAGDPERAGRLTREHITGARDRLLAKYDSNHYDSNHYDLNHRE